MKSLFQKKTVLVVGDLMLDIYTEGVVHRISPEAPVPIMHVSHKHHLPGGAGNVMLNLASLGMEVKAVGRLGSDEGGNLFLQSMADEPIHTEGIIRDSSFQTPLKNRMIASGQQIVRIDYEKSSPLKEEQADQIIQALPSLLEGVDVVAISDYGKGFLTPSLLAQIIDVSQKRSIAVIADPKGIDFTRYRGATLLKPNLSEAIAAAKLSEEATLDEIAEQILKEIAVETLMITRAKEGISLFSRPKGRCDFPTHIHEVKDVTGAGDTVLAVITATMANQMDLGEGIQLANIAAGIAIERLGCARISQEELSFVIQSTLG